MATQLKLKPVDMTPARMRELEAKGLIERLAPGRHALPAKPGETTWKLVYPPKEGYGPHRLIVVSVNRVAYAGFGTHPDAEEFWLVGSADTQPLYLAIALIPNGELEQKISAGTLTEADFVCLRCKYNDPETSFFVMKAGIPHGEAIHDAGKAPATFYVTESRDLPLDLTDFGAYQLVTDD